MRFVLFILALTVGTVGEALPAFAGLEAFGPCKYEVQKRGRVYTDAGAMYRDAPLVVTARVADYTPINAEGKGVLRLAVSNVLKGTMNLQFVDVEYSRPLCTTVDCGGNNLSISPRQYLFFLDHNDRGGIKRLTCYNVAVNGWVDSGRVYFTEKFNVPWEELPKFLESDESLVPQD